MVSLAAARVLGVKGKGAHSRVSYDPEIRLDLIFSTKFLMGIEVRRDAINRFRARGTFSGFC